MKLTTEIRGMMRLALPIMGAQILHLFMVFVDNLMVGRLGRDPLAGLALAGAFYSFVYIVVTGLMGALIPLVSRANGAERFDEASHYTRQGLIVAVVVSVVFAAGLWWSEPLLLAIGQKPVPSAIASEYLRVMIWTVPAQLTFVAFRNFVEGASDSLPSVVIAATVALINIPLDYVLIFGEFGFPRLGVEGAAYATCGLTWLSVLMLVSYIALRPKYRHYRLFRLPKPDLTALREIVRIGVPLSGAVATEMGFFITATFLMGYLGEVELAAHQVALNATSMIFMLPLGLSFAVTIRIGQHLGRGDTEAARTAWIASLLVTGVMQVLTMSVFLTVPWFIVDLYDQHGAVRELAIRLLIIAGFFQLFDGFQCVGMGALRGLQDTRFAFIATLIAFWVCGLTMLILAYETREPTWIWYALLVGLAVAMFAHHGRAAWLFTRGRTTLE